MSSKSGGRKKSQTGKTIIADNRKATFLYEIDDLFEAGIVLSGSEIKSIRQNKINIKESYASAEGGEIFLINSNIPRYQNSNSVNLACINFKCSLRSLKTSNFLPSSSITVFIVSIIKLNMCEI